MIQREGAPSGTKDGPLLEERVETALALRGKADEHDEVWELVREQAKTSSANGELNVMVGRRHSTGTPDKWGALRSKVERL